MKKFFYYGMLALGLAAAPAQAQSPDWAWVTTMGWPGQYGPGEQVSAGSLVATADGGALIGLNYVGAVNFGGRRDTLVSFGGQDGAIIKYSASGGKQWTARIVGLQDDGVAVAGTDAQGNVYVYGTHQGQVYFLPTAGAFLPGNGGLLAKYTAAGVFVSAVAVGQGRPTYSGVALFAARVDPAGNCVIVGGVDGAVTVGSFPVTPVSPSNSASFVARVSAAGSITSVVQFNGYLTNSPEVRSTALLPNGDLLVGGYYQTSISFPPSTTLSSNGASYAVCYTPAGTVRWARNLPVGTTVAASPSGQAYAVGRFSGTLALDALQATSSNGLDVFVARLDALTGATQGLAYAGGGPGDQVPTDGGLVFSTTGLPTLTLRNTGAAQFGGAAVPAPLSTFQQFAAVQFSGAWQPQRAFTTESQLSSYIEPLVAPDPQNYPFMLAHAPSAQSFGPFYVRPQGTREVVLAHVGLVLATHPATAAAAGIQVYPNPARTAATVVVPAGLGAVAAVLLDALGRTCWTGPLPAGGAEVPVAGLAPGAYTLRLRTATGRWFSSRLLVQP